MCIIGIDLVGKWWVVEIVVYCFNGNGNGKFFSFSSFVGYKFVFVSFVGGFSVGGLILEVIVMVWGLFVNGYSIGIEYIDKCCFKVKFWDICFIIDGGWEVEVLVKLEVCLVDYVGEYVWIIGIDWVGK